MRYLRALSYTLIIISLFITSNSLAESTPDSTKNVIYEIISPTSKLGTGFIISDSLLGNLLVTCKHVVQDTQGNYVDSIFVRRNKFLPSKEAISDTSKFVVRLKIDGLQYLAEHPNPNVDLVMIPLLTRNTTLLPQERLLRWYSRTVLSKEEMKVIRLSEGTDVEVIGFSLGLPQTISHYHFSRFGKIGLYTSNEFPILIDNKLRIANFILLDMTVRPGDSGSPVIAHIGGQSYLIGFLAASSNEMEFGVAYPVYYLYDLMKVIKDKYSTLLEKTKK